MENFGDLGGQPWEKEVKARRGEGQALKHFNKEIMEA